MDNVIQNIKVEDIVPSNHNYNLMDIKVLEDLAISIKNNGIKEPLRLKRIDDKYKIISGNKRYRAAILAGLSDVPAIIDDYDNDKIDISYPNSINDNSDVINLSELNKEYERDELKMNNEFMNNANTVPMPEQPIGGQTSMPTFGGRFFPSLEDEPTNMNFNSIFEANKEMEQNVQPTNNFIDLTDMNNSVPSQHVLEPTMSMPQMEIPQEPAMMPQSEFNNSAISTNNSSIIDLGGLTQNNSMVSSINEISTPINIDNNFQEVVNDFHPNSTPEIDFSQAAPVIEPMMTINPVDFSQEKIMPEQSMASIVQKTILNPVDQTVVSPMPSIDPMMNMLPNMDSGIMEKSVEQDIPNIVTENVDIPNMDMMNQSINPMPAFDMSMLQNIKEPMVNEPIMMEPVQQPVMSQEPIVMEPVQQPMMPQESIMMESAQQSMMPQEPIVMEPDQQPVMPPEPIMMESAQQPMMESEIVSQIPQKDILPVINTLKAVGINLENFGYTIRITDEDLPNSYKITIEVEK